MRSAHTTLLLAGLFLLSAAAVIHHRHAVDWSSPEVAATFRSSVVADHGQLSLDGVQLVDVHGEPVVLRGISLHGQQWFPATPGWTIPSTVRMFGIDVVRVPVVVEASNPEDPEEEWGGYTTDPEAALERTRAAVDDALSAGVYVIIDWHLQGDPTAYQAEAIDFFERVSAEYGHHPAVIYEIANEPVGASWASTRQYAESVIAAIRANDPDNIILVGTPFYSQAVELIAADPLEDDGVMYSFHYYAASHPIQPAIDRLEGALRAGTPLFISEWGPTDTDVSVSDEAVAEAWVAFMERRQLSWVSWSLGNRDDRSSLISPDAPLSGPWWTSDLTATGQWMLPHLRSPPTAADADIQLMSGHDITTHGGSSHHEDTDGGLLATLDRVVGGSLTLSLPTDERVDLTPHLAEGGLVLTANSTRGGEALTVSILDDQGTQTTARLEDWGEIGTEAVRYQLTLKSFPLQGLTPDGTPEEIRWDRIQQVRLSAVPAGPDAEPLTLLLGPVSFTEYVSLSWDDPDLRWRRFTSDAEDVVLRGAVDEPIAVDFAATGWTPMVLELAEGSLRNWSAHRSLALELTTEGLRQSLALYLTEASGERWRVVLGVDGGTQTVAAPFQQFALDPEGASGNHRLDLEDIHTLHIGPTRSFTERVTVSQIRLTNDEPPLPEGLAVSDVILRGSLDDNDAVRISTGIHGINAAVWDGDLMTADTRQRVSQVGHSVVRYPGAEGYRWEEALQADEATSTDAFLDWCTDTGATPLFTVDYTTSPEEAARWVTHTRGRVPYWEIGGGALHRYGHPDQIPASDYGERARALIEVMKQADPSITIGTVWTTGDSDWNHAVFEHIGDVADAIVLHLHAQDSGDEDDRGLLATPQSITRRLIALREAAQSHPRSHGEHAVWVTAWESVTPTPGIQTLSQIQGLWVADFLGALAQAEIDLAAYWAIHNDRTPQGGDFGYLPRSYDPNGQDPRPAFHAFDLAAEGLRGTLYPTDTGRLDLTSYLTQTPDGQTALLLINKSPATLNTTIDIPGFAGPAQITILEEGEPAPRTLQGAMEDTLRLPPSSLTLVQSAR